MSEATADLRRSILDTARHLLITDGLGRLSMRKIANAIGYSATAIYLYFDNKDALVHTLIDEGMLQLYDRLVNAIEVEQNVEQKLRNLSLEYIHYGLENPEYYEVMFQLSSAQMARYPAEMYRRARRNLGIFEEVLLQGQQKGLFLANNALLMATTIWTHLHGTISLLLAKRIDNKLGTKEVIDATVSFVIKGVLAKQLDQI